MAKQQQQQQDESSKKDGSSKEKKDGGSKEKKDESSEKKGNKGEEKKPVTVVLKVQFHCEHCVKRVKKAVASIKGADMIQVDVKAGKVTVVGNVEPNKVLKKVRATGKYVELVDAKKGSDATKDGGAAKDGEAKKGGGDGGGGGKDGGGKDGGGGSKDGKEAAKKNESKGAAEYVVTRIAHNDFTYVFSDENPNSNCSIM